MHMDIPENNSNTKVPSVLITGGSGLVGTYLTNLLLSEGFNVSHLSRKAGSNDKVKVFKWEPEKKIIDSKALEGLDFIVHLAGANIGEKRWETIEILARLLETIEILTKQNLIFSLTHAKGTDISGKLQYYNF